MPFSSIFRPAALLNAVACIGACFATATAIAGPAASYHLVILDHDSEVVGVDDRGRIGVKGFLPPLALRGSPQHLKVLNQLAFNSAGAMNSRGDLAGSVGNGVDYQVAVVWPHDSPDYRTLDVQPGARSYGSTAISESGRVGGIIDSQCALWDAAGHLTRVGLPQGAAWCMVTSLNETGNTVVAFFDRPSGSYSRAFHWRTDGTFKGLPRLPGYETSYAGGSSRDGTVVGSVDRRAVSWFGDVITDLMTDEGWEFSVASEINDSHDAVGQAFPFQEVPGQGNAVMYSGGHIIALQPLILPEDAVGVSRLVYADKISNNGMITGQLESVDGSVTHPFVMIPVAP